MAELNIFNFDYQTKDIKLINEFLSTEQIKFSKFELKQSVIQNMIKQTLTDEERQEQISDYPELQKKYQGLSGYRADMICLYPEFEHIDFVLSKFGDIHYHYENEYWYINEGTLGFGFIGQNGIKFTITAEPGEHITVAEGKWQWLIAPEDRRLKAMRFFSNSGNYTEPKFESIMTQGGI